MPAAINEQIIFNAALKVMTERGYTGATTKLIAQEAGIGEVTLFRRFGNKETLILEAMKQEASKLEGSEKLYSGKLEADLTKIMTAYQLLLRARAALLLTFYTEVTRHPELATALEQPKHTIGKMLEMLGRYQQEGKLIPSLERALNRSRLYSRMNVSRLSGSSLAKSISRFSLWLKRSIKPRIRALLFSK